MRWRSCLLLLMIAAACDIPTALPKWNPAFAVPLQPISIPLAQLLPAGVDVSGDGAAFVISTGPFGMAFRLGDYCPFCRQVNGLTVSKPEFQGAGNHLLLLPPGVDSASIVSGVVNFRVTNGWNFDPLRPGGPEAGAMQVQVLGADGRMRGFTALLGVMQALPAGTSHNGSVAFAGPPAQRPLLRLSFASPAGDPVRIDTSLELAVVFTSGQVLAADIAMNPGQRQLTSVPVPLDFTGIDDFIIDRAQRGRIILRVDNQFGISGAMALNITGGLFPVNKTFQLSAQDTTVDVPLNEADIESILGSAVVASVSGFVQTGGAVLGPRATFTIEPMLVLEMGEDN